MFFKNIKTFSNSCCYSLNTSCLFEVLISDVVTRLFARDKHAFLLPIYLSKIDNVSPLYIY